jgi:predicted ester cyclase
MTDNELAALYRRYNACCNEHRFEDLAEFVARDVAIDGTERGLDAYAAELRAVVRAFPDYRWELRRLVIEAPWIAARFTDTGTHREPYLGVQATGRSPSRSSPSTASVPGGLPRCGARASTCICSNSSDSGCRNRRQRIRLRRHRRC